MAAIGDIEKENLLTGMVLDLSKDELRLSSKDEVTVAYAKIAKSMWHRGFNQTAWQSARLSLKSLSAMSSYAGIRAINILARQISKTYIYKPTMAYSRLALAYARKIVRKLLIWT
jgi:hypothetical protein